MKYRALRIDELEEVEEQFINFLAANTVTSQEWVTLKEEEPGKAHRLIELFSDIVFDSVLSKVQYLEHRTPTDLRLFHCDIDKIYLIGLHVAASRDFDFTKMKDGNSMLEAIRKAGAQVKMYSMEKTYKEGDRKQELFKMMENGCLIADGKLYQLLAGMKS